MNDTMIAKQFHVWCSAITEQYDELANLFVPTNYIFASHPLSLQTEPTMTDNRFK
jgi:hypothetical protein